MPQQEKLAIQRKQIDQELQDYNKRIETESPKLEKNQTARIKKNRASYIC